MPSRPYKYVIELTDEEREALQRLLRTRKLDRRLVDRARMVQWADEGIGIDETAKRLGCGRRTVIYWRQAFLDRRSGGIPACLADKPRSGRPRRFSP